MQDALRFKVNGVVVGTDFDAHSPTRVIAPLIDLGTID
jgi:hypothetical protein